MPETSRSWSAAVTVSNWCGLMTAVTSFMKHLSWSGSTSGEVTTRARGCREHARSGAEPREALLRHYVAYANGFARLRYGTLTLPRGSSRRGRRHCPATRCCGAVPRALASQRVPTGLSRSDPHEALDRLDPELAVSDLAGSRRVHDGVRHLFDVGVVDHHLEADLR